MLSGDHKDIAFVLIRNPFYAFTYVTRVFRFQEATFDNVFGFVCDAFLESLVKQEKERRWKTENQDFITEYNEITEKEGLPLDKWRTF